MKHSFSRIWSVFFTLCFFLIFTLALGSRVSSGANIFGFGDDKEKKSSETESKAKKSDGSSKFKFPPPPAGPKKRIAVSRFLPHGKFKAVYGGWDIGGGLAAQLVTALVQSGHFIVVERAELANVLREQIMGKQKIVSKGTAAQVGRILGAQLLVRGSVTEFEQEAGGMGLNVGIPLPGLGGLKLGGETVSGHVAIDLRLIDTTSGQIIQSHRAVGKSSKSGVAVNISTQSVVLGGDAFKKTPLGLAVRQAIEQAVLKIIQTMEKVPWEARVIKVSGSKVYINAGSRSQIKVGDTFKVVSPGEALVDPDTKLTLGYINQQEVGTIRIVAVQPKFSIAEATSSEPLKRGYILRTK